MYLFIETLFLKKIVQLTFYSIDQYGIFLDYLFLGLPMSLSSSNSLNSSSGGFASNSSLNSTPSADRYAALKDLDEQLRETKEREAPSNFQMGTSPNPFKNPFQSGNGVQWTTSESVFSPAPQFATNGFTNGYAKIPEAAPQPQQFNNGSANFSFNPFAVINRFLFFALSFTSFRRESTGFVLKIAT